MNDNPGIGKSIVRAFQFMKEVQRDTLAVVKSLESLLAKEKWHCNETSVASHLSTTMNADKWMLRSICRIYVRDIDVQVSSSLGAILIMFAPSDAYDEPICLCLAGGFPTPVSSKNVWDHWSSTKTPKLLRGLAATDSLKSSDARVVKLVFPDADRGAAFVIKLCDLTDEAKVKALVAEPLLKAIEGLK